MTTKEELGASKGGRPRSVQSQQAILDATLTLLATEGFEAMSIEAIAARAGVGKKTIYRWWSSKEALVIDAIKNVQQTKNPVIDTGSLRNDLIALFRNTFQTWSNPDARRLLLELIGLMATYPDVFQAYYDQVFASRLQQALQVIERAQAQGEVRQDLDATEIMSLLAGPIWSHLLFNANKTLSPLAQPERLIDAILQGIAGQNTREEGGGVDAPLRNT
ncbi:TetR family transcriptional regulator [Dictyobacter alpinus]|uniref:TetR family transcriptional regulator n=1 Tax=Dictyobacter alpinus TaxID=2014873 RepID=A0A402B866_9CHLR|nr:TetR/AcrR family transcriptional regulator [Dictyobacter alpinus]GCE27603.1 TetR family transcriptional regulator [Dictyobacter alpinus]